MALKPKSSSTPRISFTTDIGLKEELEALLEKTGYKQSQFINDALKLYIRLAKERMYIKSKYPNNEFRLQTYFEKIDDDEDQDGPPARMASVMIYQDCVSPHNGYDVSDKQPMVLCDALNRFGKNPGQVTGYLCVLREWESWRRIYDWFVIVERVQG